MAPGRPLARPTMPGMALRQRLETASRRRAARVETHCCGNRSCIPGGRSELTKRIFQHPGTQRRNHADEPVGLKTAERGECRCRGLLERTHSPRPDEETPGDRSQ